MNEPQHSVSIGSCVIYYASLSSSVYNLVIILLMNVFPDCSQILQPLKKPFKQTLNPSFIEFYI